MYAIVSYIPYLDVVHTYLYGRKNIYCAKAADLN